jgi:hypothetical protein
MATLNSKWQVEVNTSRLANARFQMLQRLAEENAQLREHCQRLEAEKRVLKVRSD